MLRLPVPFVEHRWVKKGVNVPSAEETEPDRTLQVVASLVPRRSAWGHLPRSLKNKQGGEQRPWLAAFKGLASEELKGKAAAASVSSDSQRPSISKMWQLSVLMALDKASSRCPASSRPLTKICLNSE